MKSFKSRAVVYSLVVVLGVLCALPSFLPASMSAALPGWYSNSQFSLGLDLRGGSHLLLEIDRDALFSAHNEQIADNISQALRSAGLAHSPAQVAAADIRFSTRAASTTDAAAGVVRQTLKTGDSPSQYRLRQQGTELRLELQDHARQSLADDAIERSLEVLRKRLNETGLVEPSISRQGGDGILVQLPGVEDPQAIRKILGTTAQMTFHWVVSAQHRAAGPAMVRKDDLGETFRLEQRVALSGTHIHDAQLAFQQQTGEPVVTFRLDTAGARQFAEMTRNNIGRPLAVVLDGRVITAPVIRSVIGGGSGEISGAFSVSEASNLALLLRAGALPAKLQVIEERTVGPDLGNDSIQMGLVTGVLGALLVLAFMVAAYGSWGLIACFGLAINVTLVFGVLSLLGATLTLPGIAGIILTLGMAVDANILINERIREELRRGRSARLAVQEGFSRAYGTILDANATTLITVSLLFLFGSGPVRGFAVTIGIGLLTSLFTAVAVTRLIMEWRVQQRGRGEQKPLRLARPRWLDALWHQPLNVMRGRVIGLGVSALLSLASIALFIQPGLQYGVDFSGGVVAEVRAPGVSLEALRTGLAQQGLADIALQEFGGSDEYLLRVPVASGEQGNQDVASGTVLQTVKLAVLQLSPQAQFERVDLVGPKVSGQFSDDTILALLLAAAGLVAYLWIRFETHFALAAALTIALDLTKTIGFFVLAGVEFNLTAVAALLALIGYSINDKVVVFDRIRENLRATPEQPLLELLNDSITATLSRTLFTSFTSFLALLPMAIAGGMAVSSFALPMLFGIVIGTSSSVFIAAPIIYYLGQRRRDRGLAQLRPTAAEIDSQLAQLP
ncbi:protein translocase subunit SecD [Pseudomaricurvus alcaniphilus]|uniref:protein translocase subunit SecD n=1 Tax=Pseudomaricurvus alcaniphilus TaxID=1166482 RepID=UPI00140890BD|nr:protein translocase subunit SecD [Pseudomaricurvus alcaniphilus]NHN38357.1 protein translocase subunit SecD [Pseudomaricurvus alcaniphilus]